MVQAAVIPLPAAALSLAGAARSPALADSRAPADGFALPVAVHLVLLGLLIIGAGMWIGGMTAVTMLAVISKRALEPAARTELFHQFGRRYFPVFGAALLVAAACGLVMLLARGWDGLSWAIVILVAVTVVALAAGVVQARSMSRLRSRAAELRSGLVADGDRAEVAHDQMELALVEHSITGGARSAALLRAGLGVLSAAVFVLAICTAG